MTVSPAAGLGRLDKLLPVWILLAMISGILLGRFVPGITTLLNSLSIGTTSIPIAIGLLWMMYPVLAKVKYEEMGRLRGEKRMFGVSLVLNWILGPLLMFSIAWLFLADFPEYRVGLILVGLARCIAMVLIWNFLAGGDSESCAILVAINSLMQIVLYSFEAWFYISFLSALIDPASATVVQVSLIEVAVSVLVFLGIPLAGGIITRSVLLKRRGAEWYDQKFAPRLGPIALVGLLYTIVMMFSLKGDAILELPLDVLRISLPLLLYFLIMFLIAFGISYALKFNYEKNVTISFTAASNNFELAIAVAIGVFGIGSGQALAAVVGPLIEVPVLVGLVYVALHFKRRFYATDDLDLSES
ncbi:MAG: ACR3 family arsenite efflux transporter [Candidatus Thorarchaeota archaeon]